MFNLTNIKDFILLVFYFFYAVLLPGWLLARVMVTPGQLRKLLGTLPTVEKNLLYRYFHYLFAPAVGLILVDGMVLMLARLHWALSFNNFFVAFSAMNVVLLALNLWLIKPSKIKPAENSKLTPIISIFLVIFLASVLLRTVFYLPNAMPQDTDLGHHMYWAQWMVQKESYPVYDTPEVIEGEHIIFAVLSKLSGIGLLSALPLLVLSFYNLMMILALPFTALAIGLNRRVALWVLFLAGVYFAVDPPQARYVKGGVIGNTFGNLFIPLVLLLFFLFVRYFYRQLNNKNVQEKSRYFPACSVIALALVIIFGSFYTHHLSTFLLGIVLAVSALVWMILTFIINHHSHITSVDTGKIILNFLRGTILRLKFILTLAIAVLFSLFVYIPYYLRNNAISTVTQDPEKETHLGITLLDYIGKMGWTRFILVIGSIILILIALSYHHLKLQKKIKIRIPQNLLSPSFMFLFFGWFLPLALLSFYPLAVKIDLPSRRVVNYLVFPGVILAAMAAEWLFGIILGYKDRKYFKLALAILVVVIIWDGTSDFRGVFSWQNKFEDSVELYSTSQYLANFTRSDAVMLKDHRTIAGDSWIKFFLLRGYDYFLSRTYDYKYADANNNLDPCTREMITVPDSNLAKRCYGQTGINYVIVKPTGDEFLFWKGKNFQTIYSNDDLIVFKKAK
jgi:hypothetical protein